ncbi:cobyrinate a,c-diamide synthase [Paroceanicella profunda]|uniref:Hydrogenobyrinate a,c-diamide synthase n=1 Tax=Paroceanicella profunda TaxID=2579971 RepID=A0A5B8FSZ6_9RHOB|nr:cobyrinate a,c-diamide synthase [Paroceanicella profunda]QDL90444.1 cobyrinate a,c-diamide synthase [Paroceanicella profunda]
MSPARGLVIAAPASGSGKTTLTLGLLRALARAGRAVRSAKSGPDYIDPAFHAAATGAACVSLDAWAMRPARLRALAARQGGEILVVEGAMGLFDGAPPEGRGSTADLAQALGLPVLLVVDAARQGQSVAALVEGFARHRPGLALAGVVLNRVGSARHERLLRGALGQTGVPVLGAVPRLTELDLPSRHLGLVQAGEHPALEAFLDRAADRVSAALDLPALLAAARPLHPALPGRAPRGHPPPGQRVALARDAAFAFAYPHQLADWHAAGAEILPFSPLADEAPAAGADAIFLPGGYPELHAGRLAAAARFRDGLHRAARAGTRIEGECGGYMVLGDGLEDAGGARHAMLGLLRLETSFARPRLHLGYRRLLPRDGAPRPGPQLGHEFHYASTTRAEGAALYDAEDAEGQALGPAGLVNGSVSGSFAHVIDRETEG